MPQNDSTILFAQAFRGMEPDASRNTGDMYITRVSQETTKQIPFGFAVMAGTTDETVKQFTSQTGKLIGIVPYANIYQVQKELSLIVDSDGNLGLLPQTLVSIKRRGRLWVAIDEDVVPTSAVRIRTTVVSTQGPGVFRKTANAGDTVNVSKIANWTGTFTAALGYGLLEYDMTGVFSSMTAD